MATRRTGSLRPELIWPGPEKVKIVSSSDVRRCPTTRLDPKHYRPDGTCMCVAPRDASLEPHLIRGGEGD